MSHPLRPTALLAAFALVAALLSGLSSVASAAGAPLIQGDTTVSPGIDHASDTFSDPWDYRNELDVLLDVNGPTHGLANQRLEDGKLVFDLGSDGGNFWPLYMNVPGSLSDARDGPSFPLNADRYTHVTIRMYADQSFPGAMLRFFTCESYDPSCQGGYVFGIRSGWHTYTLRMQSNNPFGLDRPWDGAIVGLRLDTGSQPDGKGAHVEVDWIRAHDDGAATTITWANPGDERLYWDRDTDPANNSETNRGWGVVDGNARAGTVDSTFLHGAYEQGTYHFFTGTSPTTGTSAYSEPFTIDAAPMVSFEDPDETGGEDYATVALGNPWDFSEPADATEIANATDISWSGGQLHATNTSNDPFVRLRQAGPIDPERYHRLTIKMTYDGEFNLADEPGGGTHGRLIWWRADTGDWVFHNSREILTFATRDTYTFDLTRLNFSEPGNEPWSGSPVTYLRWDPNEDPGAARWHLDHIKLAADDEATGGTFDVRWRDHNGNDGASVALFDDRDRRGYDGQEIVGGITQVEGANTHRLNVRDMLPGRRWLYAEVDNGTGIGRQYARGPLRVDPRLSGSNRDLTAIALSRNAFPRGADAAVVAYDGDFPDALAAAPLAAAVDGPVLLNPQDHLSPDVEAELERLGIDTVYLMGGPAAQSDRVERGIEGTGVTVQRVAGTSRWGTAAEAARTARDLWQEQGVEAGDHVLVALGTGFADALAAGPLAAAARRPLVLVAADSVPEATNAVLAEFGTTDVTFIGGTAAIPESTARQVGDRDTRRHRIGGTSRFGTAVLVADAAAAAGADPGIVLVAPGGGFPDALAAGPAVAARGGVLLLTAGDLVPSDTRQHLSENAGDLGWLRVAGGRAVVSDAAVGQLLDAASLPH